MCTISCFRDSTRLLLTMNRDELRTRAPELPPRCHELENGLSWLAPADGEQGGTWIGLHCTGWAACVMNRYPQRENAPARQADWLSRGEIIGILMQHGLSAAFHPLEAGVSLDLYRPFTLVVASLKEVRWAAWDGQQLSRFRSLEPGWRLLTSSSWKEPEVRHWRQQRFEEWVSAGARFHQELPLFHRLQPDGEAAWSPLMERPTTHTRSITQVRVQAGESSVMMNYWPRPAREGRLRSIRLSTPRRQSE